MKYLTRYICLLLPMWAAMNSYAQDHWNAAGVWTGSLYNDSTKKFIPFEIAISYHNGKYTGYTCTVFVIDSVENIGVKEVAIKEKNKEWIIKDKKLIDDNYREAPAKGVYTTMELQHTENDTADILSGRWFTNKTKEFFPLTGTVMVAKRKNIFATRIVPKLRKLGLANNLSFFSDSFDKEPVANNANKSSAAAEVKDSMMTIVEPELVITLPKPKEIKLPDTEVLKNIVHSTASGEKQPEKIVGQSDNKNLKENIEHKVPLNKGAADAQLPVQKAAAPKQNGLAKDTLTKNESVQVKNKIEQNAVIKNSDTPKNVREQSTAKTEKKLPESDAGNKIVSLEKSKEQTAKPLEMPEGKTEPVSRQAPVHKIDLSNRKIETIRTVAVTGDSLVLSLFDNGAVDGDTVSVLLNGKVVISKVGLLERAFNQTIHLTPEMGDSIKIVLYAENLGSIPPNTGLLVVRNAGRDFEIRFSGDLTKNSAIILLRNNKE